MPPFEPSPESSPEPSDVSAVEGLPAICPRCQHDLNGPLAIPSDRDRLTYLQCILGSQRFTKAYSLFAGKITIVFRAPLPTEADLIATQLEEDVRTHRIQQPANYLRVFENYRFAATLAEVRVLGRPPLVFQSLGELPVPDDTASSLPQLHRYLSEKVFSTESYRRAVMQQWRLFEALMSFMEAKADDNDFFSVAAEPA